LQTFYSKFDETQLPAYKKGEFFTHLPAAAQADLDSMLFFSSYPANTVLFSETQPSVGIIVILEGEVKLSMNSCDGHRLSLRINRAGEVLGLPSTLSGTPHEATAETVYPVKIAHVGREAFLQFLVRHPDAYHAVAREMTRRYTSACDQLRTVGLASGAPAKLARLLLEWSDTGDRSETGSRCRLAFTHEQIGEFIGASRETVTRALNTFKDRRLVNIDGSMLTIPSRHALESYAQN